MHLIEKDSWTLSQTSWMQLVFHSLAEYPREACGVLLCPESRSKVITEALPAVNSSLGNTATRYALEPRDMLALSQLAERNRMDICGFYHSHPGHPAIPSEYDKKHVLDGYLYLIVSVNNGALERSRAWKWNQDNKYFDEVVFQLPKLREKNEYTIFTPKESRLSF